MEEDAAKNADERCAGKGVAGADGVAEAEGGVRVQDAGAGMARPQGPVLQGQSVRALLVRSTPAWRVRERTG